MIHADLHIHSNYSSDGELEVPEIVNRCQAQGVDLFSLTDHNSIKGAEEATYLAQQKGICFIPGIEIDCNYEGIDLHVIGYHANWKSHDFARLEKDVASKNMASFATKIKNIKKLGFLIDADAVLARANGKQPTGELIAEVMLTDEKYHSDLLLPYRQGGERGDMPYINFYLDYFAQGKPAFVPVEYMTFQEAVEMIRSNGGVPIVAHPGLNLRGKENLAEELLKGGAEGLEVFNNYHSLEQIYYFASLVYQKKAIMTCGSDFHGKNKPLIAIGQFRFDTWFDNELSHSIQRLKKSNS